MVAQYTMVGCGCGTCWYNCVEDTNTRERAKNVCPQAFRLPQQRLVTAICGKPAHSPREREVSLVACVQ